MPDPNAKLMPEGELPELWQSFPTVTQEEMIQIGQRDFQQRLSELLADARPTPTEQQILDRAREAKARSRA